MTDPEMKRLRGKVSRLMEEVNRRIDEVWGLEQEADILELGWGQLDIDLYSTSFLLSRSKAEQEEHEKGVMPISQ